MNPYDHEDAFKPANRYAGRVVNLSEHLKRVESIKMAVEIIEDAKKQYADIFDAFIEGVEWGRNNPK